MVADDEPVARRGVRHLLSAFLDFELVGEARDGREVLAGLSALAPDVLFLDIRMPSIGGLEIARARPSDARPLIVFLTAYEQFALNAFDADVIDYLVKPVSDERFGETISRLRRRLRHDSVTSAEPVITVTTARSLVVLPLHAIDWIEAADYCARVWSAGHNYLVRESLDHLEHRIGKHGFVRAHRRALVRVNGVRAVRPTKVGGLVAVLACGVMIPVSRRRRATFIGAVRVRHA